MTEDELLSLLSSCTEALSPDTVLDLKNRIQRDRVLRIDSCRMPNEAARHANILRRRMLHLRDINLASKGLLDCIDWLSRESDSVSTVLVETSSCHAALFLSGEPPAVNCCYYVEKRIEEEKPQVRFQ